MGKIREAKPSQDEDEEQQEQQRQQMTQAGQDDDSDENEEMGGDVREKDESAAKVKPAQPGQEVHFKSTNVPTLSGKSILRWQYCCA